MGGGGISRTGLVKKTILVTDVAQRGVLGAYLLITLNFSCQHDQLVDSLKRGVLGTVQVKRGSYARVKLEKRGQIKKRDLYCGTYLYWTYM